MSIASVDRVVVIAAMALTGCKSLLVLLIQGSLRAVKPALPLSCVGAGVPAIEASEFSFENDSPFPGSGIFRVTTTEPMICAIVWGETEALGRFNNSLDMNGTGIVEHDVFLPDAEAGATYFYRVQGSTADGTLYQSEMMTFTLPEASDGDAGDTMGLHGENLALGASVVNVSSEFSASWAAGNAVDDDRD